MSIFSKQRPDSAPFALNAQSAPQGPPSLEPGTARERVRTAADQARAEIADLVRDEQEAIEQAIASACDEVEQRLRGAAELRIDKEMKRLEEAEATMRRDIKKIVRSEVSAARSKKRKATAA